MYLDEGAHLDHVDTVINIGKQNIIHQSQGEDLKPTTPWNLPNSVDSFTGREEELKDLKSALTKDGKSFISQNIVGLSGIGKTSLAVEYAWRNKEDYDFIAFIKASSQDSLTNDFKELGIMFRFQEQQPIRNIIQFVYRKLSEYRSVLLIFDDAESLSIIRGQGLETGSNCNFEVPQIYNNKIHWLVTTKNQNFSDKSVIKLKEFSLDEARSYIKDRIPDLSKDDLLLVESLAITLGRFPLALSYATAYIKQNKDLDFSILKYLDLYKTQEEERKKLLSLKIETELHIPVYNTWQISIRALEKHQKSIEILKYCACLAPEIIPLSFIKLIINTDSEIEFNEALQELKKYSFIEIQEFQREGSIKGIIVHSLLQEVIRLDLKEQYNIKLNFIVSKIQETYPTNKKQMSDYSFAIMLIPHLNVLIKKNKENILLLQMTADAYDCLGNYNEQKELLEEALAIKVKHYQTREHIDVAITMASLAQVYSVKNDFQQALKLIENAYQILQEYLKRGENHPFIKRVLNIKQKIEKAALSIAPDTWLRFRLEKLEKKSDDEETHLALGDYYMHIEDINNAIAHYEKIVALLPEQALADHNLACCYNVRGQEEDKALAVKHFERAIALKPTSSVFCEYGHFLYQLFNKTIPINRGLLEETTLQLIQAINLADDTIINYGNLEKPVIEEYLQRLIGEQGEIIIKPSCLAYYLLIKSYFILGHYVDAKQSLDNFEKHLVNLFNISADGSSNNLQIEHLLLDKIKGEYITKHKHKDARMQHEYDKRFGLIVWHSTTRKAQKFSEATLKAISQDKEKYSLFYKVVTEYDMEALDVLMAAGLVNLQEPFLKSTMLHMCLQKFTISIGKFISNDCKLSENPTQKVCDVIDLLFEKADANIKNGQEETPLQIIDRFCPVVVEEIHNEEFNACKQKLLGYANRYHSTEVNNHNEILVSKIKLKFSGKYAQTYFPISEKYAYLPEIANKNLEDKPINLFNKYKR